MLRTLAFGRHCEEAPCPSQLAPEVGKKTLRFRADTVRKRAAKTATDCWSGRASGPLTRNLGGALAVEAAKSSVAMAVRARQWKLGTVERDQKAVEKKEEKAKKVEKAEDPGPGPDEAGPNSPTISECSEEEGSTSDSSAQHPSEEECGSSSSSSGSDSS